ncbi:MAG: T9SS type A sorting domain-containing protein [Candidatus Coatesbacteria bacterium]|nr:MAG: T9SS type A sorting domain-containing protein [Candidatus Coatesbacteria bacterium]
MKKGLIVLLVVALAAPALAFKVFTYNGKIVKHGDSQLPWTMRFNQYGTPDCANEFQQLLNSLNAWSNVSNQKFRHARGANTNTMNRGYDGINLCVWYEPEYRTSYGQGNWPWSAGAIAVNIFWLQDVGSFVQVVENDVNFNGYNYTWSDSGEGGKMDVANIATHEFGHNLVLADLYDYASRDFTMYGYASFGETKKRTLHQDDIDGIRFIYGYPGVTLQEFTATPREGQIRVAWKTTAEINHAGFNLYRREDAGGDAGYVKLNRGLIVGRSPYEYRDEGTAAGTAYQYLLEAVDLNGHRDRYGPVRVQLPSTKLAFALAPSYPNPARTEAVITFALPEAGPARLTVYDVSGRRVATLAEGPAEAGEREVVWDLTDDRGASVPPGVYFYRLETPTRAAARRLVVAR